MPTAAFEVWPHTHIQGEPVDDRGLPLDPTVFTKTIPAVVPVDFAIKDDPTRLGLTRITEDHGRSYRLAAGIYDEDGEYQLSALFADRYGNSYTTLSTKGNNFTRPAVFESLTAPSGFIPYGLMEDDALLRVLRSSRMLREAGVDTEWIVRIAEPKQLLFDGEYVSQTEYKQRLITQIIAEESDYERAGKIAEAIEHMSFFVTLRAMSVGDRPNDFFFDESVEAVTKRLGRVLRVYDLTHRDDEDYIKLDPTNMADRNTFFTDVLPRLVGRNMAKLHQAGLMHTFPVVGNVNALGGMIDLDSVKGEPLGLGDAPIGMEDWAKDVDTFFEQFMSERTYHSLMHHLFDVKAVDFEYGYSIGRSFLTEYFKVRGWSHKDPEGLTNMLGIMEAMPSYYREDSHWDFILPELTGKPAPLDAAARRLRKLAKQSLALTIERFTDQIVSNIALEATELYAQDEEISDKDIDEAAARANKDACERLGTMIRDTIHSQLSLAVEEGELRMDLGIHTVDLKLAKLLASVTMPHLVYDQQFITDDPRKMFKLVRRLETIAETVISRQKDRIGAGFLQHPYLGAFNDLITESRPNGFILNGYPISRVFNLSEDTFLDLLKRSPQLVDAVVDESNPQDDFVVVPSDRGLNKVPSRVVITDGDTSEFYQSIRPHEGEMVVPAGKRTYIASIFQVFPEDQPLIEIICKDPIRMRTLLAEMGRAQ